MKVTDPYFCNSANNELHKLSTWTEHEEKNDHIGSETNNLFYVTSDPFFPALKRSPLHGVIVFMKREKKESGC